MVKHHKKGRKRKVEPIEPEEKDLNRFAGSSDEEEHDDEEEQRDVQVDSEEEAEDDGDEVAEESPVKSPRKSPKHAKQKKDEDGGSDASGGSEEDSDVEEERMRGTAGMANAMARILGVSAPASGSSRPVILSKTKTPLQKMAEKEKQEEKEMKEKRRSNRERNLAALHVPLSVATTGSMVASANQNSSDLVKELEQERVHRRVATRGVVALFNAISQHQKKSSDPAPSTAETSRSKAEVKKLTKHGFLDMIKSTAASKQEKAVAKTEADKSKPQWNALHDDFMMDSKKKWDQESSEEEDSDNDGSNMDGSSDEEPEKKAERKAAAKKKAAPPSKKRRRSGASR